LNFRSPDDAEKRLLKNLVFHHFLINPAGGFVGCMHRQDFNARGLVLAAGADGVGTPAFLCLSAQKNAESSRSAFHTPFKRVSYKLTHRKIGRNSQKKDTFFRGKKRMPNLLIKICHFCSPSTRVSLPP